MSSSQLLNYCNTWKHLSLEPLQLDALRSQCDAFVQSKKFNVLDTLDKNAILVLMLQLDLLTCHDVEARTDLEKLVDLVGDPQVVSQSEWFIYYRSVILQCQGSANDNGSTDNVVYDYLDKASQKYVKDTNRAIATSLTGSGDPQRLRDTGDLYIVAKRKAAMLRKKGGAKYVEALLALVDERPLDSETWAELADVYGEAGEIEKAHSCWLEVLVSQPYAYNVWAKLGELSLLLHKTQGKKNGNEYLRNAVRYFSRSIELCELYARGWSGLYVALKRIGSGKGQNDELLQIATDRLNSMVKSKATNDDDLAAITYILGHN